MERMMNIEFSKVVTLHTSPTLRARYLKVFLQSTDLDFKHGENEASTAKMFLRKKIDEAVIKASKCFVDTRVNKKAIYIIREELKCEVKTAQTFCRSRFELLWTLSKCNRSWYPFFSKTGNE